MYLPAGTELLANYKSEWLGFDQESHWYQEISYDTGEQEWTVRPRSVPIPHTNVWGMYGGN